MKRPATQYAWITSTCWMGGHRVSQVTWTEHVFAQTVKGGKFEIQRCRWWCGSCEITWVALPETIDPFLRTPISDELEPAEVRIYGPMISTGDEDEFPVDAEPCRLCRD